jgi:protein-disulfide isomerase
MRFPAALAALALALFATSLSAQEVAGDHAMGNPKAPVTVIEYGSVACPVCGHFNETVMPELKAKYIDTGKVRYIYRPMLTGVQTIAMSGERLAECAGNDRYFAVVDAIMRGQKEFYAFGESDVFARPVLLRIAKSFGFDEAAFDRCAMDPAALKAVNARSNHYLDSGIHSTPTLVVNGKAMIDPDFKTLSAAIDAAAH